MNRRESLAALLLLGAGAASPARAQERVRRIGCLFGGSPKTHGAALAAFLAGLREYGWAEGRNVTLEPRWAEGRLERVPALAADVVRSRPDLILTAANVVIAELKKATASIPIIMATGADPVEWGLVASLSRPGGNLTGLTGFYESTPIKMLELIASLVPRGSRVAALLEAHTPFSRARYRAELDATAKALELRVEVFVATTSEDVARAIGGLAGNRPAALIVLPGPMLFATGGELVQRATALRVPAVYPFEEMCEAGGLMSYAVNLNASYKRAAFFADRIFRGANPGELPIEQPTRLSLAVNLKTAKAQGIRVPQDILLRADRVIE